MYAAGSDSPRQRVQQLDVGRATRIAGGSDEILRNVISNAPGPPMRV